MNKTGKKTNMSGRRGQSTLELAVALPLLMLMLSVVIEGGFAINAWIRVSTAARDASRFAVDSGRADDVTTLVQNKLAGIDFGSSKTFTGSLQIDVYIITGTTNDLGNIPNDPAHWYVDHHYGTGSGATVDRTTIETRLASQGGTANQDVPFTIVEVDYSYTPLLATLVARGAHIPISSYALIQQY